MGSKRLHRFITAFPYTFVLLYVVAILSEPLPLPIVAGTLAAVVGLVVLSTTTVERTEVKLLVLAPIVLGQLVVQLEDKSPAFRWSVVVSIVLIAAVPFLFWRVRFRARFTDAAQDPDRAE